LEPFRSLFGAFMEPFCSLFVAFLEPFFTKRLRRFDGF
jgi:hypothetical protein